MNILALSKNRRSRSSTRGSKAGGPAMTMARSASDLRTRLKKEHPDLVVLDQERRSAMNEVLEEDPSIPILIVQDIGHVARFDFKVGAGSARPTQLEPHTVASLHQATSGRVDARRVARFFGLSLSEVARLLGRSPQAVHKTPDAPGLQQPLSVLLRIATALTRLYSSPEKARIWLNAPHPDLDKARPLELITGGKAEIVADQLEDALLGHPS